MEQRRIGTTVLQARRLGMQRINRHTTMISPYGVTWNRRAEPTDLWGFRMLVPWKNREGHLSL
ncbi:hypothetical protein ACFFX0_31760 [Citricoccus parietis]|uniref:Uncharacterized protein n=1 Tax=Citricoccus parietis TaxID=592307 RepID=A0ABV5GAL9_9MICC